MLTSCGIMEGMETRNICIKHKLECLCFLVCGPCHLALVLEDGPHALKL